MGKLHREEETYAIRSAIFEVYREKGAGFVEAVYQECLEIEFGLQDIPFVAQAPLELRYKGRLLRTGFKPDFVCHRDIIVELKAVSQLAEEHHAQIHNYLKASGCKLGLLVNFGHAPGVEIERIIR